MWYTKRYDDTQIKANKAASDRAVSAQDNEILRHPDLRKKTWSAEMPAYYGTELCAGRKRGSSMGPVAFSKYCNKCDRKNRCVWPDEEISELTEDNNGTEEH